MRAIEPQHDQQANAGRNGGRQYGAMQALRWQQNKIEDDVD
jgi:hypothetical protein